MDEGVSPAGFQLQKNWTWVDDWAIEKVEGCDELGWKVEKPEGEVSPDSSMEINPKVRRWVRHCRISSDPGQSDTSKTVKNSHKRQ